MAETLDGTNFNRSRGVVQPCQRHPAGVSGWFRPPGRSASWTLRPRTERGRAERRRARMPPGWPDGIRALRRRVRSHDDGVDEGLGVEGGEVVGSLAEADELDRDAELALDRHDDAALGRAVELGQHDAGDVDRLGEDLGLLQAVLPGGGVEDEQHLVDLALLLDDALDLAELVHEADLVVQAAGGVDDDDVGLDLPGRLDRVARDRRGVSALLLGADRGYPDPGAPRLELVRRGGPEGVRRPKDDIAVLGDEYPGQ